MAKHIVVNGYCGYIVKTDLVALAGLFGLWLVSEVMTDHCCVKCSGDSGSSDIQRSQ